MEDTQAITWDEEEEDTQQPSYSSGGSSEPVGRLHVFSSNYGPEKDFPLYLGKNVVGRLPDCSVTLPFSSISKQHAVIEILARDRAPLLQDCGSLNGTQILRPTKVLSPGVSHRLRDQQLILFADLPCQYHRLDAPQPSVSRGPLTVEETPRAQGGIQPTRLLLAEDSEEELDSHLKKCVMKDPRSAFSPWATVVPESDEEGLSPAPGGPGPSSSFKLESDTDEEEGQLSAAEETSSAARRSAAIVAKQPNGVAAKQQPAVTETGNDTEVQKNADNRLVPDGVILERNQAPAEESNSDVDDNRLPRRPTVSHVQRAQPSDVMDSDTDVEEEKIPATPAVVPVKKRHGFCGVGPSSPGALGPQESQAGGDADGEESKASLAIPLVRSQAPMVINSDTDEEEEISAALTLARLKESPAAGWNRDRHVEGDRGQPKVLLHQNQSTSERDSDTDMEEEKGVPEGQTVPSGHTNRNGTLYTAHSTMSAPPPGEKDIKVETEMSSPGIHLQRSQDCTTVVVKTEKEEEVSREPAVGHLQKGQVLGETTNQIKVEAEGDPAKLGCEADAEEGTSLAASVVTDAKKNQIPVKEAADTDYTTARQESAVQLGAQDRSPVAQVEQNFLPVSKKNLTDEVVDTGSPGGTTQSQREGAQTPIGTERELHMGSTKGLEEDSDDFDDLELQATQCFVDRDVQHLEDLNVEDESLLNLPPEPGSSCCSSATMDVSWELMATQPFCTTESDASETQSTATHPEAHGFCLSPPSTVPQEQRAESPEHTELLGSQGRAMQTMEKDMGTAKETADRVTPERGPCERDTSQLPPGEQEATLGGGQSTREVEDREQQQLLAGDTENQEPDHREESASPERDQESLQVEMETAEEIQSRETEKQTLGSEVFEREVERPVPEKECEPARLEVTPVGERREQTEGSQDQREQASSPRPQPGVGEGEPQGLASTPIVSESQSGGGRGAPGSPTRQLRDHLKCNLSRDETSKGDPECPDACRPEALTPLPDPLISQDQQHPAPQPFLPPSPPAFESSIVRTRQNGNQTPESSLSSELEHEVRPQRSSPVFSAALEPHPPTPPEQCDTPKPIPRATMGRSHRSSIKTLELAELTVPDFQPSTSTEQSDIPRPTVRATRGRTHRSSAKTPEPAKPPVPTEQPDTSKPTPRGRACRSSTKTPEPAEPPVPTEQPDTSKPTSRGRARRSSTKTPEPAEPPVPTEQPDTSKPTSRGRARRSSTKTPEPVELPIPTEQPETSKRTSRGRARRSSTKTPEPAELPVPTEQPDSAKPTSRGRTCESSTNTLEPVEPPVPTQQPNTPKPTPRATRGRTRGSSGKALEPADPPVPPEQPDTPKPTAQATRGRTRGSSVKTPEPAKSPVPTEQSDTSKPSSRGRTRGSSVKTPEPAKSLVPTEQPDTSKPSSRGRTRKSSTKTPEQVEPIASDLEPSSTRDQPVTPKAIAQSNQSKTLRSSRSSVVPVSATSEFQSAVTAEQQTLQPIPQGSNSRAQRVTRKQSSPKAPVVHKPCSALPEPKSRSSRNQRQGAVRAAESLGTVPEPSFSQPPGVPTHAPQIQKVEASDISEVAQELPPKVSSSCKRPSSFIDSPPRHKRLRRGQVSPKTVFPREEEEGASEKPRREEDIVVPGPGKRKRGQAEKEPQEVPNRSRRRTKPLEPSAAPKVLFTGVLDPRGEQTVLALGGSLASSVAEASHLVTDRICRTVKFLCALGRGIPILSLDWLHQSRKAGCFLPPDEYVVTDPEQEKNYGFRLRDALSRARERRLLEGYEIHVTPGVQPPPPQMGEIISCCGGTVLPNMPRSYKPHRVVITCHQDFSRCSGPLRLGLPVLSPEFLLTGVLKQEATPEAFVFSTLEMPST
ncbi:mediator of DNA damage checkpoint protein 1 isoform X1 [Ochotona curzoniae]|uniref:mediator of DNA damage checkpoint protein 1 isoform X1 n=2 Tax=Ochotona curzoniae TaxID=130825 RepID=UPI001B34D57E|nr:mediator of DNA damage checkpoint protein 1 isoform X1 [Ochotona curzoniae]XP_040852753.1 mediator of DNA damage checkpoint protein 1 isoform X1 [Ochotona curzoniae]